MDDKFLEKIEISLLKQALRERYGYDFSNYSTASITRRIRAFSDKQNCHQISALIAPLIRDSKLFAALINHISVTVTEMFRDPEVYEVLREKVIPVLKTYPSINVWIAGCATGEEAYSCAILFAEEGLLDRVQIYATDINKESLEVGRKGIYPVEKMKEYTHNYQLSGGSRSFSDYYYANYNQAVMTETLRKKVLFSSHNLVSDGAFGTMHLILCRNVLIYFNKTLQERVLNLFAESLESKGFLCLGNRESLDFANVGMLFETIASAERCFRLK